MLRPLQDDAGLGLDAGKGDRLVQQRLVLHNAAGLEPAARRKDQSRSCILDSGSEFLCGKTAEHDRVHRPDPRAGQHRDHRFRHHRHIEDDAVALGDAEIGHHGRERFHFMQHLGVGQFGDDAAGQRRIVDQRHLVAAPTRDMAVERVVAGVDHGAGEPAAIHGPCRDRTPFSPARSSRFRAPPRPKSPRDRPANGHGPRDTGCSGYSWRLSHRPFSRRHARARPGHPRPCAGRQGKTWMAGASPAMTRINFTHFFLGTIVTRSGLISRAYPVSGQDLTCS